MVTMDFQDIVYAVKAIEAAAGDPEIAHTQEDNLYEQLLRAVANSECANVRLCAELALKSKDIKFPRWCA